MRNTGEKAKASSPVLFKSIGTFPRVGQGVGQSLTHTLTHNICGIFATKKHRKPKFSMLFGAGGVTRTHDLLITKYIRGLRLTVFKALGAFSSGILRTSAPPVPLFPFAYSPCGSACGSSHFQGTNEGSASLQKGKQDR